MRKNSLCQDAVFGSIRRMLCVALTGALVLGLTGCGDPEKGSSSPSGETSGTEVASDSEKPEALPTTEPAKATEEPAKPVEKEYVIPVNDGLEFVKNLGPGWVLGNTFDAIDCTWVDDELDYEGAWCGVKTTEDMIQAIKDAGYHSIRVPVSWHEHVADRESYTINEPWLNRVQEVVDYCIDRELYVVLNIHHDNNTEFLYPTSEYQEQSVNYVTAIWKQLAERFGEYDEHLIFECMNEPRMVGHTNEWWIDPSSQDCKDAIAVINVINQAFVDTIRESGGNNATRFLLCPGYDASPDGVLNSGFLMPTDPVAENDHRILLEVHAYSPYSFALEQPGVSVWSASNQKDLVNMTSFMDDLYERYVKEGTPVLIDEFGALNKNDNTQARVEFTTTYVTEARRRGMSCFWWDNNVTHSDGENFGIFDRQSCTWSYPEIMEAQVKAATE